VLHALLSLSSCIRLHSANVRLQVQITEHINKVLNVAWITAILMLEVRLKANSQSVKASIYLYLHHSAVLQIPILLSSIRVKTKCVAVMTWLIPRQELACSLR
jgi:hypothetical protein